jgi:hypothetical protein
MIYIALGIMFSFLLGYILGKRQGWATGCSETEAVMPLKLRQQSLEHGKCVICEEYWIKMTIDEKNSRDLETL